MVVPARCLVLGTLADLALAEEVFECYSVDIEVFAVIVHPSIYLVRVVTATTGTAVAASSADTLAAVGTGIAAVWQQVGEPITFVKERTGAAMPIMAFDTAAVVWAGPALAAEASPALTPAPRFVSSAVVSKATFATMLASTGHIIMVIDSKAEPSRLLACHVLARSQN